MDGGNGTTHQEKWMVNKTPMVTFWEAKILMNGKHGFGGVDSSIFQGVKFVDTIYVYVELCVPHFHYGTRDH